MESKIFINDGADYKDFSPEKKEETSRKLLWVDIGHFSELWQFLICTFVVFIFFIPYGYLQVNLLLRHNILNCLDILYYFYFYFLGSHICY